MTSKKRKDSDRQKNDPDATQPPGPTRRKVLKSLAVGSTVIGGVVTGPKWVKPVVDRVLIPAHAQCSSGIKTFDKSGTFTVPDCVTKIKVEVNGGGGGGGRSSDGGPGDASDNCPPVNPIYVYLGGNGEQKIGYFTVTPGNSYPVNIGYGGEGENTDYNSTNAGGKGYHDGTLGRYNLNYILYGNCNQFIHGGGGGSSHFNGLEASGGGGGYGGQKSKKGKYRYGQGGGPYGGYGIDQPDNNGGKGSGRGKGAIGGAFGENGANGSVVISY